MSRRRKLIKSAKWLRRRASKLAEKLDGPLSIDAKRFCRNRRAELLDEAERLETLAQSAPTDPPAPKRFEQLWLRCDLSGVRNG